MGAFARCTWNAASRKDETLYLHLRILYQMATQGIVVFGENTTMPSGVVSGPYGQHMPSASSSISTHLDRSLLHACPYVILGRLDT